MSAAPRWRPDGSSPPAADERPPHGSGADDPRIAVPAGEQEFDAGSRVGEDRLEGAPPSHPSGATLRAQLRGLGRAAVLTAAPDNTNNVLALAFGFLIVCLIVFGTIWVMYNLDHNMIPALELPKMRR